MRSLSVETIIILLYFEIMLIKNDIDFCAVEL